MRPWLYCVTNSFCGTALLAALPNGRARVGDHSAFVSRRQRCRLRNAMLRPSHCPRLDLAPSRHGRDRFVASPQAPQSCAVCVGTATAESARAIHRGFAFMLGLSKTESNRTELSKADQPIALRFATSARFALSLFIVFALAKLLVIAHRYLPGSPWIAFAFFGQDALFAIAAGLSLALIARRFRIASWSIYALLCGYA